MEVTDEAHLRPAIYLAAVAMLMGWEMSPTVSCWPARTSARRIHDMAFSKCPVALSLCAVV